MKTLLLIFCLLIPSLSFGQSQPFQILPTQGICGTATGLDLCADTATNDWTVWKNGTRYPVALIGLDSITINSQVCIIGASCTISTGSSGGTSGLGDPGTNGIVTRTAPDITGIATAPNIISLFSGCNGGGNYLGDDGACHAISGGGGGSTAQIDKVRVFNSTNESIAGDSGFHAITFDSERFDNDLLHSATTNPSRITFKVAGVYDIKGEVGIAYNPGGIRYLSIFLNGVTEIARVSNLSTSTNTYIQVSASYQMQVGDFVELYVLQTTGNPLNVLALPNFSPEFSAIYQGP